LWVFPAAYAVKLLLEHSKVVALLLCISSIFLQALLASTWLLQENFLYNSDFNRPIWASGSLYTSLLNPGLWLRLPFFKEFDNYLSHPPNYVFVAFGLLLVISGWLWQRGANHLAGRIWAISLLTGISIIVLLPFTQTHRLESHAGAYTRFSHCAKFAAEDNHGDCPEKGKGVRHARSDTAVPA
jgi:hypothetical protein